MTQKFNIEKEMPSIIHIITQIDKMRETGQKEMQKGTFPTQTVLNAMADSMNTVTDIFSSKLNTDKWKQFFHTMQKSEITHNFFDILLEWEQDILNLLQESGYTPGTCNICKNNVYYQPATEYFRSQQKKHNFPYWNAIIESVSSDKRTCPQCQSLDRERMMSLFLDMLKPTGKEHLKVLHIAPSNALDKWLAAQEYIDYETTDLNMDNVTFQSDIQDMYMVQDETYDIILCSHVLEHVQDDLKAMKELKRVLKEDGVCIFLVPLVIGLCETDEAFGLSPDENWHRFGQDDYVRLYSRTDFLNRLTEVGYLVHILTADYFGVDLWNQNGLSDIHYLYAATKKDIGIGVEPYHPQYTKQELVSIIIPTYNRGNLIERAVRSILNQTYKNLELIVVDDASTDDTDIVISKIQDSRLHYIKLPQNKGANYARNTGIKAALGKYIAFNDSDDEWLPHKLEKQMHIMLHTDQLHLGCVYCLATKYENNQIVSVTPDLEYCGENAIGNIYRFMQGNMFITTQTLLLKKEVFETVGYFNEDLKRLQDWEFLLRVSQSYTFTLVQESLVNVYIQKEKISNNVQGFVDTVRYVINLHNICHSNIEAYKNLINASISLMVNADLPLIYKEEVIRQIAQDDFFSAARIDAFKKLLKIEMYAGSAHNDIKNNHNALQDSPISAEIQHLQEQLNFIKQDIAENNRMLHEILWAQVFNSSKSAFKWLPSDIALWPGRWGVGYQYMYVISRLLNEVQPKHILETGLGQSTRLIGSYVKNNAHAGECNHLVIEHDQDWINIFCQDFQLSKATQIVQKDLGLVRITQHSNVKPTYVYQNLNEILDGKKFDFISLDAPYGTNERYGYSRVDILNYLPACLEKSFCIVLDDYNRFGEKNTVECIKTILKENNIHFAEAVYRGSQDMYLLVSSDLKFLCTL